MQVALVADHLQFHNLKNHLYHLVRMSTLVVIGFNDLKTIMIKYLCHIKNMKKLFKTISTLLPPKILDDFKAKYHTTIKAVGGKW